MAAAIQRIVGRARWPRRIGDAEARLFGFPMPASLGRAGWLCGAIGSPRPGADHGSTSPERAAPRRGGACGIDFASEAFGTVDNRRRGSCIRNDPTIRQEPFSQPTDVNTF
jgi:hypothetical protein